MCIRDSLAHALRYVSPGQFSAGVSIELLILVFIGGIGSLPVSYTHLRAHETVLDLVCRLLLEKKKFPATTTIIPYM